MITMTKSTTQEMLQRFIQGDKQAFVELYHKLSPAILACLIAIVKDQTEAEDLLQAVFLKAFRQPQSLGNVRDISAFLMQSARNLALDRLKYLRLRPSGQLPLREELYLENAKGLAAEFSEEDLKTLQEILNDLPEEEREAIMLHLYGKKSFPEMGRLLNVTVHIARYRYEKALKILKEKFNELA